MDTNISVSPSENYVGGALAPIAGLSNVLAPSTGKYLETVYLFFTRHVGITLSAWGGGQNDQELNYYV